MGGEPCQFAGGALVVVLLPIPQGDVVPLDGGEPGFEGQNPLGLAARVRFPEAAQHGGDMLLVLLAQGLTLGILLEVVVPIRQPQSTLIEVDRIAVGGLGIGVDPDAERRAAAHAATLGKGTGQRGLITDPIDVGQRRCQRGKPLGVTACLIQIAGVEIADLLGRRAGGGLLLGQPLDQHPHIGEGFVPQHVEGAIGGAIVGDLGGGEPLAIDVTEEVIAGFDLGVHIGQRQPGVFGGVLRYLTAASQQGQSNQAGQ